MTPGAGAGPRLPVRRPAVLRLLARHWLALLAAASLAALIVVVDPAKLAGALGGVSVPAFGAMAVLAVAAYLARAVGWAAALRRIGVHLGILRVVGITIAGQVFILIPTGDLARVALVLEADPGERHAGDVAATIAFQEVLYMTVLGLAMLPVLGTEPQLVGLVLPLLGLLVAICVLLLWRPAFERALRAAEVLPPLRRIDLDLRRLRTGFVEMFHPPTFARLAAASAVATVCGFLLFVVALRAVHADSVGYRDAAFIFALGHLAGAVSMLPMGLGAYEGAVTGFMAVKGIPPAEAAAAAFLFRGFNDVLMAAIGGTVLLVMRRRPPRRPLPREAASA